MTTQQTKVDDFAAAMLVSLTGSYVGADVLDMLTSGDNRGMIAPGALRKAIAHAFRHTAEPEVNGNSRTPTPSPELTARMVELVKDMASAPLPCEGPWTREARSILAELDPGDPDLAAARELAAAAVFYGQCQSNNGGRNWQEFRDGDCDGGDVVQDILSALRSRRALAEAGK